MSFPLGDAPWWVPVLYVAVMGHITNICITLFLHRGQTHGGVKYHRIAEHFMRLWLWLTTGVVTKEWVAVHRKHHAYSDREGDPHSPHEEGLWAILLGGLWFYREAAKDTEVLEKYGKGTPDDWIERHVYTPHNGLGILLMLTVDVLLFGPLIGLLVWSGMALWLPTFGQVINAIGHAMGYRNFKTKDHSHNIYPFGIWIAGEELHNNHHADPRSAKFKAHWWEFDVGWAYIKVLSFFRLAEVVYARSMNVKEFASKYYKESVADPVTAGLESANRRLSAALVEARADFDEARERMDRLLTEARRSDAWTRMERTATDARQSLDRAREKLERTHAEARETFEQLRLAASETASEGAN